MRLCKYCQQDKPIDQFFKKRKTGGFYTGCRSCINAAQKRRHSPLKKRESLLKTRFGITLETYELIFTLQGGRCAICRRHQKEFKKSLSVDHDHKSLEVRGLLCFHCNTGLGKFEDQIELLDRAKAYLGGEKSCR